MKKIIINLAFLLIASTSFAQQELQMSNYLFDGIFWNPGYTGSNDFVRFSAMYRHQWTVFPGAPKTGMFGANIPLKFDNMGIGIQFISDHLGVTSQNEIYATYAYQVRFSKKLALGIGIRAGVSIYNARLSELRVWDEGDFEFENNVYNVAIPKFGFGLYLHARNYYIGVSIPTIWAYDSDKNRTVNIDINKVSWLRRHYYASAAYVFNLGKVVSLKVSAFTKYVVNAPFQGDLTLTVGYKDLLFLSGGYRTNAAAIIMLEVRPLKFLRIAYAFDLSTPDYLRMYGGTTHEIMLGYDLIKKNPKYKTPRYF